MKVGSWRLRPFNVPPPVEGFLKNAKLHVADSDEVFVEANQQLTVTEAQLRAGTFQLRISDDEAAFIDAVRDAEVPLNTVADLTNVGLVIVASSPYLKLAQIVFQEPWGGFGRTINLGAHGMPDAFRCIHHGCEIGVHLVLRDEATKAPRSPWRKGTWLSSVAFKLRTESEGFGFSLIPLTDEIRDDKQLPRKALRYVELPGSPMEIDSSANIGIYVDASLLGRLEREASTKWAIAFQDQLVIDLLGAVAMHALAAGLDDCSWHDVKTSLLGSVIEMVAGKDGDPRCEELLSALIVNPSVFMAAAEGVLEMTDNVMRLPGD